MLLIVLLIAVGLSIALHRYVSSFAAACAGTTILSTLAAWVIAPQHFGWMDKTFYENVLIFSLTSLAASIAVGLWRRKNR